jgi:hypothetical protein
LASSPITPTNAPAPFTSSIARSFTCLQPSLLTLVSALLPTARAPSAALKRQLVSAAPSFGVRSTFNHPPRVMVRALLRLVTATAASSTMAWRSHGRTNAELVAKLASSGIIGSARVQAAMTEVDRRDFMAPGSEEVAYLDMPQPIGHGE